MQLVIPLLAFPWLGRILGPEAFGLLMYMCVIPPIINLFMDWGLPLGATRMAAQARDDREVLRDLLGSVFAAKIILATVCLLCGLLFLPLIPHASVYPQAYLLAIMLGICRGTSPIWFFQGLGEGMRRMAVWDVLSSLLTLALIFIFITKPQDWLLYLVFTSLCKGVVYLRLNMLLWKEYAPIPQIKTGIAILKETRTLFASSFFNVVYNNGVQLILGYFLPTPQMGIIVAVNKMLRALASLVNPFTQTIFPEICILRHLKPRRASHILRCSLIAMPVLMLICAFIIYLAAPLVIRYALGPDYASATSVLKIMIFAAPLMACDFVLGTQTLVSYGHEYAQVRVQALVAACSLPAAAIFARLWGLTGSAFLPICIESALLIGYVVMICKYCPSVLSQGKLEKGSDS